MSVLYERIESLCLNRGISITDLCREAKVPRAVLSELKSGRTKNISARYLKVIADYLSTTVDALLHEGNEKPATDSDGQRELFMSLYRKLKPEQREIIIAAS